MKLSTAFSTLMLPLAMTHAQPGGGEGRLLGCNMVKYFGSGASLSESGTEANFKAVVGARVECHLGCISGGSTTVTYSTDAGDADAETQTDCTMSTKWMVTTESTSLK